MKAKTIIALNGVKGCGKDTFADVLVSDHGFKKTSFAEPMKEMVRHAFPFTDEQLYGPSSAREQPLMDYPLSGMCMACGFGAVGNHEIAARGGFKEDYKYLVCTNCGNAMPTHVTARIALQTLGTEWGRRLNPDIWARATLHKIQQSSHDLWVISDLRFKNELRIVQEHEGIALRLMRRWHEGSGNVHQSEAEMYSIPHSEFRTTVRNDGPLEELPYLVRGVLSELKLGL